MGAHPDSHEGSTLQHFRRKKYRSSSEAQGRLAFFDHIIPPTTENTMSAEGPTGGKNKISGGREEVERLGQRGEEVDQRKVGKPD